MQTQCLPESGETLSGSSRPPTNRLSIHTAASSRQDSGGAGSRAGSRATITSIDIAGVFIRIFPWASSVTTICFGKKRRRWRWLRMGYSSPARCLRRPMSQRREVGASVGNNPSAGHCSASVGYVARCAQWSLSVMRFTGARPLTPSAALKILEGSSSGKVEGTLQLSVTVGVYPWHVHALHACSFPIHARTHTHTYTQACNRICTPY